MTIQSKCMAAMPKKSFFKNDMLQKKIKLLGIRSQLQDIKNLMKNQQVETALYFLEAAIDYIDIQDEMLCI